MLKSISVLRDIAEIEQPFAVGELHLSPEIHDLLVRLLLDGHKVGIDAMIAVGETPQITALSFRSIPVESPESRPRVDPTFILCKPSEVDAARKLYAAAVTP